MTSIVSVTWHRFGEIRQYEVGERGQPDAVADESFESRRLRFDPYVGRQKFEQIFASGIGFFGRFDAGSGIRQSHVSLRHDPTGGIRNHAANTARVRLSEQAGGARQNSKTSKNNPKARLHIGVYITFWIGGKHSKANKLNDVVRNNPRLRFRKNSTAKLLRFPQRRLQIFQHRYFGWRQRGTATVQDLNLLAGFRGTGVCERGGKKEPGIRI